MYLDATLPTVAFPGMMEGFKTVGDWGRLWFLEVAAVDCSVKVFCC